MPSNLRYDEAALDWLTLSRISMAGIDSGPGTGNAKPHNPAALTERGLAAWPTSA